ncbi:Xylose operon regulatory protein [Caulifigura coniformis]|uniref:Xylose operon regulatory protein n=1 Tax=Caulifigura coniformis TaxID=2527983 RepID=A0A517SMP6_9PLAN|nr:DNA-binding transcriptional regulator [Caulifigura coniformis]QDT57404.1 Xylose operon regulatory protein [Caulifigura coniformis]
MPRRRLICVAINTANSYYRNVLRGIVGYSHQRSNWRITLARPLPSASTLRILNEADGVIACVNDRQWCRSLLKARIPLVNVDAVLPNLPVPRVNVDNAIVGEMAAIHFLERGLKSFGFAGQRSLLFSADREAEFRRALKSRGYSVEVFDSAGKEPLGPLGTVDGEGNLGAWLRTLPRPAGVFTPYDLWGAEVIEACRQVSLRVPQEIAVLGVDNDELFCGVTEPPMSSIALPAEAVGVEAGIRLDQLIDKRRLGLETDVLLRPTGVICRQSTDILATDNEDIGPALEFVRSNFQRGIQVADVVRAAGISRRSLERKVMESIGMTLGTLIRRHRMERAKMLLLETKLTIAEVASRSGYSDSRRLESAFARSAGMTPTKFRVTGQKRS